MWYELYNQDNKPAMDNVRSYVKSSLLDDLCSFIETAYAAKPALEYSKCSMQKGWNIKYKKSGKSLCTIYPMEGYFIVLVVIGNKEQPDADILVSSCCSYVEKLYKETKFSCGGKWLMIEIREAEQLRDAIEFIKLRAK